MLEISATVLCIVACLFLLFGQQMAVKIVIGGIVAFVVILWFSPDPDDWRISFWTAVFAVVLWLMFRCFEPLIPPLSSRLPPAFRDLVGPIAFVMLIFFLSTVFVVFDEFRRTYWTTEVTDPKISNKLNKK
jgi:hypothetical protein